MSILINNFGVPPFSVLDTRQGYWQKRKKFWLSKGIKGELGRSAKTFHIHDWVKQVDAKIGTHLPPGGGTSIFDPMLCELIYTWFSKQDSQIIDPFAGGSVRGIVASHLKRKYWGCDISSNQIEENKKQTKEIGNNNYLPEYEIGDSQVTIKNSAPAADLVFSCPPYFNLEKYSDLPTDLSNMTYTVFIAAYTNIIKECYLKLQNNRFACFVISNIRNKTGEMIPLVKDTIMIFEQTGFQLYNEGILINQIGTAAIRAPKQFENGRKLCNVHQNVLIFIKGNWKTAVAWLGEIENQNKENDFKESRAMI